MIYISSFLQVAVRIRPSPDPTEAKCIKVTSKKSLLFDDASKTKPRKYGYDYVFGETATQEEVYETTTAPLVQDVLNGMHAAVFAYGATGSGKTHTMLGPNPKKAATPSSESSPPRSTEGDGLMVRAIVQIFKFVEEAENSDAFKVNVIIVCLSIIYSKISFP